jgi:hypothetical protein
MNYESRKGKSKYKGVWLNGVTINAEGSSVGGSISIKGKGWQGATQNNNAADFFAIGIDIVGYDAGTVIRTNNAGSITLDGSGGNNYDVDTHSVGINLYHDGSKTSNFIYTTNGDISITGSAGTGTSRLRAGINSDFGSHYIYSTSGNVTLKGTGIATESSTAKAILVTGGTIYAGWNNSSTVTSGNVVIQGDSLGISSGAALNIKSTGALTIEPTSTSFTSSF